MQERTGAFSLKVLKELPGKFRGGILIFNKTARVDKDQVVVDPSKIGVEARVVIGDVDGGAFLEEL